MDLDALHTQFESDMAILGFENCAKNPGHRHFHRLSELTESLLPAGNQRPEVLDYVKCRAQYTCKVRSEVSSSRSKYKMFKGKISGTGYVVTYYTTDLDLLELVIQTASHVVFNQDEVGKVQIELFYDDDDDRTGVVHAHGVRLDKVSEESDFVNFTARLNNPRDAVLVKTKLQLKYQTPSLASDLTYTISHPHGRAKRVSFGTSVTPVTLPPDSKARTNAMYEVTRALGCSPALFFWVFDKTYANTRTPNGDGHSPDQQLTRVMKHCLDLGLVEYPTDQQLNTIRDILKQHNFNTSDKCFNQMSQLRDKICKNSNIKLLARCSGTDGVNREGRQESSDVTNREEFDIKLLRLDKHWRTKYHEVREGGAAKRGNDVTLTYSLPTCASSSGAHVVHYMRENSQSRGTLGRLVRYEGTHSGVNNRGEGLSKSGASLIVNFFLSSNLRVRRTFKLLQTDQFSAELVTVKPLFFAGV